MATAVTSDSRQRARLVVNITSVTSSTASWSAAVQDNNPNFTGFGPSGAGWRVTIAGTQVANANNRSYDFGSGTYANPFFPRSLTGTVTGLSPSTTYTASGSFTGAGVVGSASLSFTFTTAAAPPPPAPTTPSWSTGTTLSAATVGSSYSATVSASPVTSYSLIAFSGATGGFNVSNNTISGTPTTAGTASFTFRANNSNGTATATADRTFNITVNPGAAVWSTGSFTETARIGTAYSKTITATGIRATNPYELVGGTGVLPAGLTLNRSTGVITGTPTAGTSQTFNFTVNAYNEAGTATVSPTFTLNRRQPLPTWSDEVLGQPRVATAYSDQVVANNAAATNAYSAVGLPANGLSLNANTGAVTGTPVNTSSFSFTITAKNSDNETILKNFTLTPLALLAVWSDQILTTTTVRVNQAYTDGVAATNAVGYALQEQETLPPGIALNTGTGAITGTPTTPGTYPFRVVASNASATPETITTGLLTIVVEPSAGGAVWNGTEWVPSVFKVWNGSDWIESPVKIWNGSAWADPAS